MEKEVAPIAPDGDSGAAELISGLTVDGKISLGGVLADSQSAPSAEIGSTQQEITAADLKVDYSKYDKCLFDLDVNGFTGNVKVTLNIPADIGGFSNYAVYHHNNNTWDKLENTHDGDKTVTFTATDFSPFAIVGYDTKNGGGNWVSAGAAADTTTADTATTAEPTATTTPVAATPATVPNTTSPLLPEPPATGGNDNGTNGGADNVGGNNSGNTGGNSNGGGNSNIAYGTGGNAPRTGVAFPALTAAAAVAVAAAVIVIKKRK